MDQESTSEQAEFKAGEASSGENPTPAERLESSLKGLRDAGLSPAEIGSIATTGKLPEGVKQQGPNLANQVEAVMAKAIAAGMTDRQIESLIATSLSPEAALSVADRLEGALALAQAIEMPKDQITGPLAEIARLSSETKKPGSSPAVDALRASLAKLKNLGLTNTQIGTIATGTDSRVTGKPGSMQNPGQPKTVAPPPSSSTPTK